MRKLNFWIIQRAEQTVYDDRNARLMRSGIIANQLEARGHKIPTGTSLLNLIFTLFENTSSSFST